MRKNKSRTCILVACKYPGSAMEWSLSFWMCVPVAEHSWCDRCVLAREKRVTPECCW